MVAHAIELARLQLDSANPRLDDGTHTQREALAAMIAAQGEKLVALARDIAHNGLSPLDRFLVMESDSGDWVVLEGNRRLAALKLLLNPEMAKGGMSASGYSALKELSAISAYTAESKMDCVEVKSRDEAIHWLRLRHGGQLDGAGTVDWGATERDRFESRAGRSSPELQLLQFATSNGVITSEQANLISITNLRRLLSDAAVRDVLGLDIDRKVGRIATHYQGKELIKPLKRVLSDLAADDFVVGDIYSKEDRKEYLKRFGSNDRPDPKQRRPAAVELDALPAQSSVLPAPSSAKGQKSSVKPPRKTVAPTTVPLKIGPKRLKDIHRELQRLRLEEHANAGAVLLRVFLELTVDSYIRTHKLVVKDGATLAAKLQKVHDDLLSTSAMSKQELTPVRKAISGNDLMAASVPLFNLYVHELSLSPSPGDVRTAWDNLELFFRRVWAA